jgi:hypothetical protein
MDHPPPPFSEQNPPSIEAIRVILPAGPWRSKSGGRLDVPFLLPHAEMLRLFEHDAGELARIPADIRGLRVFALRDIPRGGIGGGEFHRLRTEVVFPPQERSAGPSRTSTAVKRKSSRKSAPRC